MAELAQAQGWLKRMMLHPRSVAALCVVCALCFCGLTGHMLWELRQQAWDSAMQGATNLLTALSRDIGRNVEIYDLSLQAGVDGLKLPGLGTLSPEVRQAILFDRASTAKFLGGSLILDETGQVVEDAGSIPPHDAVLADRDYFRVHRDNPDVGLFISAPFQRRVTGSGDLVIAFSRRVNKADGSFGGVVSSTLRLEYLRSLFRQFRLGAGGTITLYRTDGTVLMRSRAEQQYLGRVILSETMNRVLREGQGQFTGPSPVDSVRRVVSFNRIEGLPLVLVVAVAEADIYAAWNGRAAVIAAVLGLVFVAMGGLGVLFSGELRRRFRAEAETRASEAQLRLLADHATDVIVRLDASMVRRYVSSSCRAVLGYEPDELVGQPARDIIHPEDWPRAHRRKQEIRQGAGTGTIDYRLRHRDGSYVWVEAQYGYMAGDDGFTVVLRDISLRKVAERDLAEAHNELRRIATTDGLTGLANRRRFDEAVQQEWRRAAREELPLTLLLLDVDRFKQFNDRYGHQEGDGCLRAIAQAVSGCARRPADLVARYGGEEIAVLLPGTDEEYAAMVAERVRLAVAALAWTHADNEANGGVVTASIGVSTVIPRMRSPAFPPDGEIKALIVAADQALYVAKKEGRNRVATGQVVEAAEAGQEHLVAARTVMDSPA